MVAMKGFIIQINDEKLYAGTHRGAVVITTHIGDSDNGIYVTVGGIENSTEQSISWINRKLILGDKIKITAANIKENSKPEKVELIDRQELLTKYHKLKEMLTQNNMLK